MSRSRNTAGESRAGIARPRTEELSRMLFEGRSWSGHERNCAYLNLGRASERFANVSAASGLDFDDDARALASCDWDGDGDLDLWLSDRNAPRLRLMRNNGSPGARFVQFELADATGAGNRDAIGARIEVRLAGDDAPLIRTLRAGEGFLSQGSKRIHFGLGQESSVEDARLRWPDGTWQELGAIETNRRYRIERGKGAPVAMPVRSRDDLRLAPKKIDPPPPGGSIRIPAVTRYPMPALRFRPIAGRPAPTQSLPAPNRWLLVNLWATWCAPCRAELAEFESRSSDLASAGVDLLALTVDGIATSGPGDPEAVAKVLSAIGFSSLAGFAEASTATAIQQLDNYLSAAAQPVPVPTSILIDPNKLVAVLYKGRVSVDQVIADAHRADLTLAEREARAAVLPGSTIDHPAVRRNGAAFAATRNFRQGIRFASSPQRALHFHSEALAHAPDFHRARVEAGKLFAQLGQRELAVEQFERVMLDAPDFPNAPFELAMLEYQAGKIDRARQQFEALLGSHPDHAATQNNLAWLLATHPDPAKRDCDRAVELARKAVAATRSEDPGYMDTLAVARAGTGDYAAAIRILTRAIEVAEAAENQAVLPSLRTRLADFRAGRPFPAKK